jgi:hypothetical protein
MVATRQLMIMEIEDDRGRPEIRKVLGGKRDPAWRSTSRRSNLSLICA